MADEDRIPAANALQACRRKRRYETEREADDAAYAARMEGRRLSIYECDLCGGWHLTSRLPGEAGEAPTRRRGARRRSR